MLHNHTQVKAIEGFLLMEGIFVHLLIRPPRLNFVLDKKYALVNK